MTTKEESCSYAKFYTQSFIVLSFLLWVRLLANYIIPLNDTTEARYGEIARKMLETGNWVNLLHDYGVPFWAKPPLSTWLSALSMKCFGVNEFAARLPALSLSMAVLGLMACVVKKHSGSLPARVCMLVLAGSLFFYLDSGVVMTDPALLFSTTLSLVAFWHAARDNHTLWSYVFFIGLGLGLLAKGPIAVLFVMCPIFIWTFIHKQWALVWHRLPWIKGTLVTLLIAAPWYVLAEIKTPGFLNYFIVGEHLNRFLVPGWSGDKYGFAHHAPKGMIWVYALLGIFPWNIIGFFSLFRHGRGGFSINTPQDGWMSYWFLSMMTPLLFFTLSGNIIYPYVLPALPAFALLFAELWVQKELGSKAYRAIVWGGATSGVLFLMATFVFLVQPQRIAKSQKSVVDAWLKQGPSAGSQLIYWADKTEFSAQFYSAGKVRFARTKAALCPLITNRVENYLVIDSSLRQQIPKDLFAQWSTVERFTLRGEEVLLVKSPSGVVC